IAAGSSPRPRDRQSSHARYVAAGGRYPTSGSADESRVANSDRFASKPTSNSSSHGPPARKATSDATIPSKPVPKNASWGTEQAAAAGPGTINAAFSPGRFHAFDAETSANARAAPSDSAASESIGVWTAPEYTSGA